VAGRLASRFALIDVLAASWPGLAWLGPAIHASAQTKTKAGLVLAKPGHDGTSAKVS
jgi:hypothetical protein